VNYYKLPDFSFWQDNPDTPNGINFSLVRNNTKGVIIRAGQNLWPDNEFSISWKNAKKVGLLRGSYWFYDSTANPKRQAEKYAEVLGDDPGEMELWCDFEDRYGGEYGGWRNWHDFMERLKVLLPGKQLGVYTGYYYWQEFAAGVKYFSQYPLWIAWYNQAEPLIPPIWKTWTYWQYTDDYPSDGWGAESNEIDMNYFNGTEEDFLKRYGEVPTPIEDSYMTAKFKGIEVTYKKES
jgi:GH25 family lysozyme M1 (1,4-beta-N-acetylmuramidase)